MADISICTNLLKLEIVDINVLSSKINSSLNLLVCTSSTFLARLRIVSKRTQTPNSCCKAFTKKVDKLDMHENPLDFIFAPNTTSRQSQVSLRSNLTDTNSCKAFCLAINLLSLKRWYGSLFQSHELRK